MKRGIEPRDFIYTRLSYSGITRQHLEEIGIHYGIKVNTELISLIVNDYYHKVFKKDVDVERVK